MHRVAGCWPLRAHAARRAGGGDSARPRAVPPNLTVSTVHRGLHRPWDLAFTPSGGMLFTERGGRDPFLLATGGTLRTLAVPRTSSPRARAGCSGWRSTPRFATNRRIYTCFMSNRSGALDVRVVRWRMNAAVDRAHRPDRHRHRPAGEHRAPLGLPAAVRARRPALDRHRGRGHADRAAEPHVAWAARCSASTPTARACRGTRPPPSIRASTPTGTATCRASPSAPEGQRVLDRARHGS